MRLALSISSLIFLLSNCLCLAQTNKVLIIGIDGVRADALRLVSTPNIDTLLLNATYSYDALNDDITISGPGWSSMLTGVWSAKHGVTDNSFTGQNYNNYPHFFKYVEDLNPSLHTASICHWAPINNEIVLDHADFKLNVGSDLEVANETISYLNNEDPDILFVHFDDADGAGHGFGFSHTIPEYSSTLEVTDTYIGDIIDALENRPNYNNENWLIISCTDHGGLGFSHGGNSFEEENIFFFASGDSIPNQEIIKDSTILAPVINCLEDTILLNLDSSNDYVDIPSSSLFDFGEDQDFTIECRVKTTETGDVAILGNKNWDSGVFDGFVFSFKFPSGPEWKVNIGDGTNRADINTGGSIADGEWHTLSVSFDRDGMMKMYEDGTFLAEESISSIGNIDSGFDLRFGADANGNYNYNGNIAEVRVWNAVIDSADINLWHCTRLDNTHANYTDLLGYWKINDGGSSTEVMDSSPNGNDGSLVNANWVQDEDRIVYDYTNTPRITDVAISAMSHLCMSIDPAWDLDGKAIFSSCPIASPICVDTTYSINILQQNLYHAIDTIQSKAIIEGPEIILKAGTVIELNQKFEVKKGTNFKAEIETCN